MLTTTQSQQFTNIKGYIAGERPAPTPNITSGLKRVNIQTLEAGETLNFPATGEPFNTADIDLLRIR